MTRKRAAVRPLLLFVGVAISLVLFVNPANAASRLSIGQGSSNPRAYVDAFNRVGAANAVGNPINPVHQWWNGCNQDLVGGRYGRSGLLQPGCRGEVHPVVGNHWSYLEGKFGGQATRILGYPYNDSHRWGAGWVQDFDGGVYGWNIIMRGDRVSRAQDVRGDVLRKYVQLGGANGFLGFPTTDEYSWNGQSREDFEGGSIIWNVRDGARLLSAPAPVQPSREQKAVAWAIAEINSPRPEWSDQLGTYWSGWCEVFVEVAYNTRGQFGSAMSQYYWQRDRGRIHTDANPPPGAMVFYNTGGAGHVALSIGGGQIATTYGFVGNHYPVRRASTSLFGGYLGWSYAPDNWSGR